MNLGMNRKMKQTVFFLLFRGCAIIVGLALAILVGYIVINGAGGISWDFLTQMPSRAGMRGGILPAIVGSFLLMLLVMAFAVPIGVLSAVYLVEYEKSHRVGRIYRLAVLNLAGVPSVVYGLLGLGFFIYMVGIGSGSLLAGGLTLGVMCLPLIIIASREAIKAVPSTVREASLALGATKWQTVQHHVLPYSLSGIMTGIILALSRAAGETAPILLIGVSFLLQRLPSSLNDPFMALPFHIYYMATQASNIEVARPIAYATALVLIMLVIGMNLFAIALRKKYRDKYKW
jgi:phosphate transport system permease protein